MTSLRKTRSAIAFISGHTRSEIARTRALALGVLVERAEASEEPGMGGTMLRELVALTRELAGRAWLDANADDPDVGAFAALDPESDVPSAGTLDEILSSVLWARFAPGPATG